MRGLFLTSTYDPADYSRAHGNFDKVAVQWVGGDSVLELEGVRKVAAARAALWDDDPAAPHAELLVASKPDEIILQAEGAAQPILETVAALRGAGFKALISLVSNLNPSRTTPGFDAAMHHHSVRMLVECYLPEDDHVTPAGMLAEAHWRGYPHAEAVLGCYRGWTLADYAPLPSRYWIWEADQMEPQDWRRP